MAEQGTSGASTHSSPDERRTLKRRGILAAAGAVVASIVAKQAIATQEVAAADNSYLQLGHRFDANNTCTLETGLFYNSVTAPPDGAILLVSDSASPSLGYPAVIGAHAVSGAVPNGVSGRTYRVGGRGVVGEADGGAGSTAVGVYGFADAGTGVYGDSQGLFGVYGKCLAGTGVVGSATTGLGVYGVTAGTGQVAGVYGFSPTAYGIIGNSTAPGYSGLTAITGTPGVAALGATATVPTAYAAFFTGTTIVNGDFAVTGSKSAAVAHPDGTHRLLYCVEAPEAWFEDFGTGTLAGGTAAVKIDPNFAALVRLDDYHVFLTAHSDQHLHIAQRTPTGFTVQAGTGGGAVQSHAVAAEGTFSYRVVARRKDNPGTRLEKFTLPKINVPDPNNLPKPEPPKQP